MGAPLRLATLGPTTRAQIIVRHPAGIPPEQASGARGAVSTRRPQEELDE